MTIHTPELCPACGKERPKQSHLIMHQRRGELCRVGEYLGSDYVFLWRVPRAVRSVTVAEVEVRHA